jgi:hypothetical protein
VHGNEKARDFSLFIQEAVNIKSANVTEKGSKWAIDQSANVPLTLAIRN